MWCSCGRRFPLTLTVDGKELVMACKTESLREGFIKCATSLNPAIVVK